MTLMELRSLGGRKVQSAQYVEHRFLKSLQ